MKKVISIIFIFSLLACLSYFCSKYFLNTANLSEENNQFVNLEKVLLDLKKSLKEVEKGEINNSYDEKIKLKMIFEKKMKLHYILSRNIEAENFFKIKFDSKEDEGRLLKIIFDNIEGEQINVYYDMYKLNLVKILFKNEKKSLNYDKFNYDEKNNYEIIDSIANVFSKYLNKDNDLELEMFFNKTTPAYIIINDKFKKNDKLDIYINENFNNHNNEFMTFIWADSNSFRLNYYDMVSGKLLNNFTTSYNL